MSFVVAVGDAFDEGISLVGPFSLMSEAERWIQYHVSFESAKILTLAEYVKPRRCNFWMLGTLVSAVAASWEATRCFTKGKAFDYDSPESQSYKRMSRYYRGVVETLIFQMGNGDFTFAEFLDIGSFTDTPTNGNPDFWAWR